MICLFAKISFHNRRIRQWEKGNATQWNRFRPRKNHCGGLAVKTAGKTRAETVEFLAADIRKAVEQGYSLNEIRDTLAKAGISAPLSRMKALCLGKARVEAAQTVGDMRNSGQA